MLKHIVMWRLHAEADGATGEENAQELKRRLEALKDSIPEIVDIEAGLNLMPSEAACDVVLYSTFEDAAALDVYRVHPDHQKVGAFLKLVAAERYVVDYEA